MVKVLFVCLGNICRSPMAEAVFRDLVVKERLEHQIEIDSAGTGRWHVGKPPHHGTAAILKENNIDSSQLRARQIVPRDLEEYDYIVGMDQENIRNILSLGKKQSDKRVFRLLELVEKYHANGSTDVPDPYYTGNFQEVYEMVLAGCEALLAKIKAEHQL
ncbi:low molecular weight protein-tyrosine-phosphatase [Heyndrickxia acidicola]|uniref:protein-tyrosine-phosphatase n=1 Tax=Heyndrickxia acidicola TaxID=209389 RepID=A0ABU6MH14_9BACI|nr:low molecular weight protein-tyrosine-phosphatase [Heyndrickxia acidicola]MED1202335.1 low molecular weight phosphotyrosine protein phosphatase [Heyndrickxia acidicola]